MGVASITSERTSTRRQLQWGVAMFVIALLSISLLIIRSMGAFMGLGLGFCPSERLAGEVVHNSDRDSSLAMKCQDLLQAQGAR
jgi:hypothetical protein